ncbi:MAG TPA: hypothetical protein PKC28_06940 [Bdellovibrionales bacterium]|nr:hypothetical protein [Bdellovibrionales bacterium]
MTSPARALGSQSGQAVVEYVLILVVTVSLILGGIYQLNSAFKSWANNYFGNYLACLLETGELPTISGTGGDSGICNAFFEPYSFANGRPLLAGRGGSGGGSASSGRSNDDGKSGGAGDGGGTREGSGYTGGASHYSSGRAFGASSSRGGGLGSGQRFKVTPKGEQTNPGGTQVSDYGGYGGGSRRPGTQVRYRIDTGSALRDEREGVQRRKVAGVANTTTDRTGKGPRIRLNGMNIKAKDQDAVDSSLTVPDFLRYLIIAAIILALILFLGGQALQIGKSMDN